jgi:hypothetical protein
VSRENEDFPKLKARRQSVGLLFALVRAPFSTAVPQRTGFPFDGFPPRLKMIAGLGSTQGGAKRICYRPAMDEGHKRVLRIMGGDPC